MPGWKSTINTRLRTATGYELRRVGGLRDKPVRYTGDRLVPSPVFVLCSVRSGSTLLRVLLDSHPQIRAPHELHLSGLGVSAGSRYVDLAMQELGLERQELEHLLWDRVLHHELGKSGKSLIVEKTPANVLRWHRLRRAWPQAKFVFLLRHPSATAASWSAANRRKSVSEVNADVLKYMDAVEEARQKLPGVTVRYEDLTAEPERELRRVCEYLGVPYDAGMLDYGATHDRWTQGVGDWRGKIKSGQVQAAPPVPAFADVDPDLQEIAKAWGYGD